MRITFNAGTNDVNVYNICTEHDDRTEFELTGRGGKYHICYPVVATEDMGNEEDEDFTKKGDRFDFGVSDMTARELHFFMQGVFAGENKARDAED